MNEFRHGELVFDVDDSGPREGETFLLLHGFPANRACWSAVAPPLVEAGYRVLAPDQRGYSPRARPRGRGAYRLEHLTDDAVSLLDAAGVERAHVVGHDWGGAVAWAFAERHPDRLRTLTSLGTPHPRAMVRAAVRGGQALRSWYMLAFQLPLLPERTFRPAADARLRSALRRTGLPAAWVDAYVVPLQQPGAATGPLNWYRAIPLSAPLSGGVHAPTLFVYAGSDRFLTRRAADLTAGYVAGPYRFEVLDGVSHWIAETAPQTVAQLLVEHARAHR